MNPLGPASYSPTLTTTLPSPKNGTHLVLAATITDAYKGSTVVSTVVVVIGSNMTYVSSTVNNILETYNSSATDNSGVIQSLAVAASQVVTLGGNLTPQQSVEILVISAQTSYSPMSTDTTNQVAQLLYTVASSAPSAVIDPRYVLALKQTSQANSNTESSRLVRLLSARMISSNESCRLLCSLFRNWSDWQTLRLWDKAIG